VCLLDFGIDVMYNLAALIFLKAPGKNEKDLPSESMVSALSYLCHFFLIKFFSKQWNLLTNGR